MKIASKTVPSPSHRHPRESGGPGRGLGRARPCTLYGHFQPSHRHPRESGGPGRGLGWCSSAPNRAAVNETRKPRENTEKYRKLPETTENYRKLPGYGIFGRHSVATHPARQASIETRVWKPLDRVTAMNQASKAMVPSTAKRLSCGSAAAARDTLPNRVPVNETRKPWESTEKYRKLPEITGIWDFGRHSVATYPPRQASIETKVWKPLGRVTAMNQASKPMVPSTAKRLSCGSAAAARDTLGPGFLRPL